MCINAVECGEGQKPVCGVKAVGQGGMGVDVCDGYGSCRSGGRGVGGVVGDDDVSVAVAANIEVEPVVVRQWGNVYCFAETGVVGSPIELEPVDTRLGD